MTPRRTVIATATAALLFAAAVAPSWALTADEVLAGADARIEQHRTGDAVLVVTRADGTRVPNGTVAIQQTRHAFLFGCNIYALGKLASPADNEAYANRFAELFNYATTGFYWWSYERKPGRPDYARTQRVVEWAGPHGVALKGHPLAWNHGEPKWLPEDPAAIRNAQLARIAECVRHFGGEVDIWDVVNEATKWDRETCRHNAPKLTKATLEPDRMAFVRDAFRAARCANPDATLLINDYVVDDSYATEVIEKLVDAEGKRLYDVIGIQSHQHGGAWGVQKTWDVCERFARFNVPLHFTETTILSGEPGWELANRRKDFDWASTPDGEARQARDVTDFYTILFSHPAVEAITWWDFCDQRAWQRAPAGLLRKDLSPKPAYEALHDLIKGQWWTKASLETNARGEARFRGFYGDYDALITVDGATTERAFSIIKGTTNRIVIRLGVVAEGV
jgi:endo-1,4-beta-xylanase